MTFAAAAEDAPLYSRIQSTLLYHRSLLRDEVRNAAFYEALKSRVSEQTTVLDIGAGSGIWAIAAARLGAKRVVAVESDEVMIPVLHAHIFENGVAHRVEIVHGNSLQIELAEKFDVIISETIGNQAFEENIAAVMLDARRRYLADGGAIIPQKVALVAAPARVEDDFDLPRGVPLEVSGISSLTLNLTSNLTDKTAVEMLGETRALCALDLREIMEQPDLTNLSGSWELNDISRANAVVLWTQTELTEGVFLDTWNTTSWLPVVLRFKPFAVRKGTLEFNLNSAPQQYQWTLRVASAPNENPQTFSPYYTYSRLKSTS